MRRAKEDAESAKKVLDDKLKENWSDYQSAVVDFKEGHDDWDEVVSPKVSIPESVYYAIVDLGKDGPRVSYYLGQHPEQIAELAELTPYSAVMEVGRLAERLKTGAPKPGAANSGAPSKPKPRIPEPVKPVSTAATSSGLTFREIAAKPNYPGKVRDLRIAQRAGR
jgi:hypothetical protein